MSDNFDVYEESRNFKFLKHPTWSGLLDQAEMLAFSEPAFPPTVIFVLGQFLESLLKHLFHENGLNWDGDGWFPGYRERKTPSMWRRLRVLEERGVLDRDILQHLTTIQELRNPAVHEIEGTNRDAENACRKAFLVAKWIHEKSGGKGEAPTQWLKPVDRGKAIRREFESLRSKVRDHQEARQTLDQEIRDLENQEAEKSREIDDAKRRLEDAGKDLLEEKSKTKQLKDSQEKHQLNAKRLQEQLQNSSKLSAGERENLETELRATKGNLEKAENSLNQNSERLSELEGESAATVERQRKLEGENDSLKVELQESANKHRVEIDTIQSLKNQIKRGRESWKDDYPADDWREVREFYLQRLRSENLSPFEDLQPIGDDDPFASGRWGELFQTCRKGGSNRKVLVKLPKKLKDPTPENQKEQKKVVTQEERQARNFEPTSRHVTWIDAVAEPGFPGYIVYSLVDGETLHEVLVDETCLPVPTALRIIVKLTRGLEETNKGNVAYTDISPRNIVLQKGAPHDDPEPILIDLGMQTPKISPKIWREEGTKPEVTDSGITRLTSSLPFGQTFLLGVLFFKMVFGEKECDRLLPRTLRGRGIVKREASSGYSELESHSSSDLEVQDTKILNVLEEKMRDCPFSVSLQPENVFDLMWGVIGRKSILKIHPADLREKIQEVLRGRSDS